jgi:hypothetical protein
MESTILRDVSAVQGGGGGVLAYMTQLHGASFPDHRDRDHLAGHRLAAKDRPLEISSQVFTTKFN